MSIVIDYGYVQPYCIIMLTSDRLPAKRSYYQHSPATRGYHKNFFAKLSPYKNSSSHWLHLSKRK